MRQNVPPAHFGYMASGIDDEVTLRAQPRGLPEIPAAAAAAGRRQQGRHERRHPRHQIRLADRAARRSAASARSTTRASSPSARAAKVGNHLQIMSTMTSDGGRGRDQGARRADLVPALRHQQVRGGGGHHASASEHAGCTAVAVTVDRSGGRNQETLFRLRPHRHARLQRLPRPQQPADQPARPAPMFKGVDLSGPAQHPVVGDELGLHQADARRHQDEDGAQGHPRLGGRGAGRRRRHRRHHRVQPRRALRGLRAARPSTRCRRSSRR